ncbi:MAG: helix-turn-helix transcriptional regulator [Lachnospiraceae bacterium]|nr:helix-turn-helix transcriptional regulator [Lachnospiraceae bacterium]
MPLPLKAGYHFNLDRTIRPAHYEMLTAEAYTDFYGISYMVSGDRLIYSPEFTTIVQAGELTFIPKNVYRRTTYISNAPYERIILKFTDEMVSELVKVIGKDKFEELFKEHVIRFEPETRQKIEAILTEMEEEWNSYNQYSELILKGLLHKLIITCVRERIISGANIISLEKKHDCLASAIKYIKAHLRESPSLEETAKQINISSSYLSKIFVTHLNTSYSDFLLNEKITYARKLLVDSKLNMTEIAFEAGFSSNAYFSDCFKRIMGMSPLKYRKENS